MRRVVKVPVFDETLTFTCLYMNNCITRKLRSGWKAGSYTDVYHRSIVMKMNMIERTDRVVCSYQLKKHDLGSDGRIIPEMNYLYVTVAAVGASE